MGGVSPFSSSHEAPVNLRSHDVIFYLIVYWLDGDCDCVRDPPGGPGDPILKQTGLNWTEEEEEPPFTIFLGYLPGFSMMDIRFPGSYGCIRMGIHVFHPQRSLEQLRIYYSEQPFSLLKHLDPAGRYELDGKFRGQKRYPFSSPTCAT